MVSKDPSSVVVRGNNGKANLLVSLKFPVGLRKLDEEAVFHVKILKVLPFIVSMRSCTTVYSDSAKV
jgi:hypothetical protein